MGYRFNGFFAQADASLLELAMHQWPFCIGRSIAIPFTGIGIMCPSLSDANTDEAVEIALEQITAVEEGLIPWSKQFPSTVFVYIEADCVGGNCLYDGYVCRDGSILVRYDSTDQSPAQSRQDLKRLLTWLGLTENTIYFAPFERGFFRQLS